MTKYPNRDPSKTPAPDDEESQGRTEAVTFYLTPAEKRAVKREAEEVGDTLSTYCVRLLRRQRKQEAVDEKADELNVEQRFDELAARAIDRIEESAETIEDDMADLRDLNARAGTYSMVNFALLKRQFDPTEALVSNEFDQAAMKLKQPLGDHEPTEGLSPDSDPEGEDDGNTDVDDLV